MGSLISLWNQSFPPKSKFQVEDIPDLTGKVVVVTGGNTGIGYETIKAILPRNAKVYLAARSKEKAEAAIKKLKEETGKEAIFLHLDLASIAAVRQSVEELKSKETAIHVLFNSGAVMFPPVELITTDGYDLQFGTNVLGHYIFTAGLLPLLLAGAKSSSDGKARVVNSSSSVHMFSSISWDTLKDGPERKKLGTTNLYSQSKFAIVVFSNELARRYADKGIVSTSLNPGNIRTELQRHVKGWKKTLIDLPLYPAPYGALTQLWAGTSPETANMNGEYLVPWARVGPARKETRDPKIGEKLWNWLEEQAKQ